MVSLFGRGPTILRRALPERRRFVRRANQENLESTFMQHMPSSGTTVRSMRFQANRSDSARELFFIFTNALPLKYSVHGSASVRSLQALCTVLLNE